LAGSIGNLYDSVEDLDETYVRSGNAKGALLAPAGGYAGGKLLQLPEPDPDPDPQESASKDFYCCRSTAIPNATAVRVTSAIPNVIRTCLR
jgi:hypothetical protein